MTCLVPGTTKSRCMMYTGNIVIYRYMYIIRVPYHITYDIAVISYHTT